MIYEIFGIALSAKYGLAGQDEASTMSFGGDVTPDVRKEMVGLTRQKEAGDAGPDSC